jgi:hypothetical protein
MGTTPESTAGTATVRRAVTKGRSRVSSEMPCSAFTRAAHAAARCAPASLRFSTNWCTGRVASAPSNASKVKV